MVTAATTISSSILYPEDARAALSSFLSGQYALTVDKILANKFGNRDMLYTDDAIEDGDYKDAVTAYIFSRWRYIAQCLEYLETEYDPIENYRGSEREVTTFKSDEKTGSTADTFGQRDDKIMEPKDTTSTTENVGGNVTDTVLPAAKTTETTTDKQTTTTKTAPFESGSFHNKDQVEVKGPGTNGETVVSAVTSQEEADEYTFDERTNEVTTHSQLTGDNTYDVTSQKGKQEDRHSYKHDSFQDQTVREFQRAGNLGLTTSSQMLSMDAEFWAAFRWLDDLAHDLAVILASSVWAM